MAQPEASLRGEQAEKGVWVGEELTERDLWVNTGWIMLRAYYCAGNVPNSFLIDENRKNLAGLYFDMDLIDNYATHVLPVFYSRLETLPFLNIKQRKHWRVEQRLAAQSYFVEQTVDWQPVTTVEDVLQGLGLLTRYEDATKCFLTGVELNDSFTHGVLNIPSLVHEPLPIRISSQIETSETEPCWVSGYPVDLFSRNLDGSVVVDAIPVTPGVLRLLTYLFHKSGCERGLLGLNQWKPDYFRPIFWQAKP